MRGQCGKLCNLTKEEQAILNAYPTEDLDKANIKWPKRNWKLRRGRRDTKPKTPFHPGTKEARKHLEQANRSLDRCEECGFQGKMQIHHIDQNPFYNDLSNLRVLCRYCHGAYHNVVGMKDVKTWYWGTIPDF